MEHKFGVFKTVDELNRAADAQKAEGDMEALYALAAENGICKEDVDDYVDGAFPGCLATPQMAALGKLDMEAGELKLESQLADWKEYVASLCVGDEDLCHAVFSQGKELAQVLADALKHASVNRVEVPGKVSDLAGLPRGIQIGMTGRDELRRIAYEYYLGAYTGEEGQP